MKTLFEAFQKYCTAIADQDDIFERILLIALGCLVVIAAFLIGSLLLIVIIATHGLILIPIVIVYYAFKGMIMYGRFLKDTDSEGNSRRR